jgi:formate hydrogenlyase subunit 4
VIALVVVAFVIPYVVLSSLDPGTAVYGFWSFFALVVVALISWGVKDWRDPE